MSNSNKKIKKNSNSGKGASAKANGTSSVEEKMFVAFLIAGITLSVAFIVLIALFIGIGHGGAGSLGSTEEAYAVTGKLATAMGLCGGLGAASFVICSVLKKTKCMFSIGIWLLSLFSFSLMILCNILIGDVQNETDSAGAGIIFVLLTLVSLIAGIVLTIVGGVRNRK